MSQFERIAELLPEGVRLDSGDDVLRGRGEWLFERDGGRNVLGQMRGNVILAPKAAHRWQFLLESRTAWLKRRDAAFVFAIAPDAYAVMSDKLPDGVVLSPRRPAVQVLRQLERGESFAQVLYPLEELTEERQRRQVFSTHDSRWNANGAFVAYEQIAGALESSVELRRLKREDIAFALRPAHGDLGHRLDPSQPRKALVARPQPQAARLLLDNRVEGAGRTLITCCDDAPATTCVLIGDRAAYRLLVYMSESFGRMVFVHGSTLDHELVETERPDAVVMLADESAMLELPADVEAPTARELAARKLDAGRSEAREAQPGQDVAADDRDKVVEGKNGWLFLARDTNHVIDQHTGRLRFSRGQLEDWRHVLETRAAWLGERGIPYLFMVPPNTHAVYPEHLPDDVVTVAERPVLQLQRHLRETASDARILYPLEELTAHKARDLVYIATDTHWNELGAFVAYKVLMKEVAEAGVDVLDLPWERTVVSRSDWPGDLGSKIKPERTSTQLYVDISHRQTHYAFDNRVMFAGRRVEYTCRAAPPTTCLIHGDSFTEKVLHFMGESFSRVVFCQMPSLDYQMVAAIEPDIVIGILNERFLFHVAYDATAPTLADLEAAKQLAGRMYAPRPPDLQSPRVDSFL